MTHTVDEGTRPTTGEVRAFMIADVRGYSRFTFERGDEAAAHLAARFADVAEEVVAACGGTLTELRGGEALAAFSSARQALRAATELQRRCAEESDDSVPLQLGIGLDAGEAVPVRRGYRGAALNLAARLCAIADPGAVLVSDTVANIARKVEGLEYADRGLVRLKGFANPVKVFEVLSETQGQLRESHAETYRVQLLGPFTLVHDERPLDTSRWQRRVGVLFRLLLVAPSKRRMREEVIDLLWPDASPEAGAGNLRLLAYRLRQALGNPDPPPIVSDSDWIAVNPVYHWEVDLDRLEELAAQAGEDLVTLEEAARLVQGEPLPEDRYEDWAMPIRERVQRQWREMCLRLARLHRSRAAHEEAVSWYERVLERDPVDEEALQQLLTVLLERGRQTEALRRYRQFEERLAEELGVRPEPQTLALVVHLQDRATQPAVPSSSVESAEHRELVPVTPAYPLPRTGPLVGRETELRQMLAALPPSEPSRPRPVRLVLLAAEAGMGKTRLLAEVVERAREAGLLTLAGGCYEQEGKLPYGPIHDAMLDYVRSQSEAVLRSQLDGLLPELARVLPELRARLPDLGESPLRDPQHQRLRLFSTVAQVLERISEDRSLLLILDDLHWADEGTLQLVHYLVRQPRPERVLIVGAYRMEEVQSGQPLARLEAEFNRLSLAQHFVLEPLQQGELAELLDERVGGPCSPALAQLIWGRSEGNPFFTTEMVRLLQQEGKLEETENGWQMAGDGAFDLPPAVRETVARRLRHLGPEEQEVLTLGAVVGREFAYAPLEAMWDGTDRVLLGALDGAVQAEILSETEEGYTFRHPLLHEVVYRRIGSRQRRRLHSRAGRALQSLFGDQADCHASELAEHFLAGGDNAPALPYALLAGDQMERALAHSDAEQYYRIALTLAQEMTDDYREAEAREKLGGVLQTIARYSEALELFEQAAAAYNMRGDREAESRVVAHIGHIHWKQGASHLAVARSRAAIDVLEEGRNGAVPSPALVSLWIGIVGQLYAAGRERDAFAAAERAIELARVVGDARLLARARSTMGFTLSGRWRFEEALQLFEDVLPLAESLEDPDLLINGLGAACSACRALGDTEKCLKYASKMLSAAQRFNDPFTLTWALQEMSSLSHQVGDWTAAASCADGVLEASEALGSSPRRITTLLCRAQLHLLTGEFETAAQLIDDAATLSEPLATDAYLRLIPEAFRAALDLLEGRTEQAQGQLELFSAAPEWEELSAYKELLQKELPAYPELLADIYLALGRMDSAAQLAMRDETRARVAGFRQALIWRLRVQGAVHAHFKHWIDAEIKFDEAVSLARSLPFPFEEARILYEQGVMYIRKGEPERARERLEEALAIFRRLGAKPYAQRTEWALAEMGTTSRGDAQPGGA